MSFHDIITALGYAVCHQLPERCPQMDGQIFPICARCLGIYLGAFLGYLYIPITKHIKANDLPTPRYAVVLLCFLALMFIDVLTIWIGLRPESALIRTATGLTGGSALVMLAFPLASDELFGGRPRTAIMERAWHLAVLCLLLALGACAVYLGPAWLFYPLVIISSLGILLIFFNTAYVILLLIFQPKRGGVKILLALCAVILMAFLLAVLHLLHQKADQILMEHIE